MADCVGLSQIFHAPCTCFFACLSQACQVVQEIFPVSFSRVPNAALSQIMRAFCGLSFSVYYVHKLI